MNKEWRELTRTMKNGKTGKIGGASAVAMLLGKVSVAGRVLEIQIDYFVLI